MSVKASSFRGDAPGESGTTPKIDGGSGGARCGGGGGVGTKSSTVFVACR